MATRHGRWHHLIPLLAVGVASPGAVWDGKVWLWDMATYQPAAEPLQHEAAVNKVVFSPDGKLLAASVDVQFKHAGPSGGPRQTDVCLWDVATRKQVCKPMVHELEMPDIRFDERGRLVTTDTRGMVRIWDHSTGKPIGPATEDKARGVQGSYSPDGRYRMLGGEDNLGILQDLLTPEAGGVVQPPGGVVASMFSPDSRFVATAGASSWLWDVATRKPIGASLGAAVTVAFSPDGGRWPREVLTARFDLLLCPLQWKDRSSGSFSGLRYSPVRNFPFPSAARSPPTSGLSENNSLNSSAAHRKARLLQPGVRLAKPRILYADSWPK